MVSLEIITIDFPGYVRTGPGVCMLNFKGISLAILELLTFNTPMWTVPGACMPNFKGVALAIL